ncbi:zinc finger protein 41 isoform X2 [Anabrus simplex]|uniref:zinc finger protein 41 isoform X2 n=1 Tax=Anabrus simplex TaxID=316456 RepID=UPI0035A32BB8
MACDMIGYCRICAQKHHDLVSVFDEQGAYKQLHLKLQLCLHMTVIRVPQKTDQLMIKPMEPPGQDLSAKGRKPKTRWIQSGWMNMIDTNPKPGTSHEEEAKVCVSEKCSQNSQFGGLPLLADVSEQNSQLSVLSVSGPLAAPQSSEQQTSKPVTAGRSRTVKREIACEYCGKTFNHTGDKRKHIRIHTGERPYQCKDCNKRFSHASNLLRHRKIHSGERPFNCPTCGKSFSRKDKMLSHNKSAICVRRSENSANSFLPIFPQQGPGVTHDYNPPTSTS